MKNNTKLFLYLSLIFISLTLYNCKKNDALKDYMNSTIEEYNKKCPFMIDRITQADKAEVLKNKTIKLNYILSLNNIPLDTIEFKSSMKKNWVLYIQNESTYKKLRENDVNFIYSYKDEKGNNLTSIEIFPKDYKNE